MASIEDRWYRTGPAGRIATERHGRPGRWRVRYADPDGRSRAKSFEKKIDAERFRSTVTADIARGRWIDPDAGKRTVTDYAREWEASRTWDPTTAESQHANLKHITGALGSVTLGQLRPSRVQAFVAGLPLAPSTATGVLTTLRALLQAAVDDDLIPRNPAKSASVRAPRVARRLVVPWTPERIAAIRAGLPVRYQAMVDCGSGLGLRQGEVFGLDLDEVDFLRRVVHVRQQVKMTGGRLMLGPPKGGKERDVPLPRQVAVALAAHIERHPPRKVTLPWRSPTGTPSTTRLLFTTPEHRPLRRPDFNLVWRAGVRTAGIEPTRDTGMHQLRHYYASVLLAAGVDVKRLSVYLGHHSAGFTLATYAHLLPDAEGLALRAIESALETGESAIAEGLAES